MAFVNMTAMHSDSPNASAIMEANTTAVGYSNQAVSLSKSGQFDRAAELHQKALDLKIKAFGEESVQAAISYNGLGECLLKAGKLDQAEAALRKALKVRDLKANGGLGMGPPMDSAVTRDNMGALFEAHGKFEEARQIRLSGADAKQMACSNYDVSVDRATGTLHKLMLEVAVPRRSVLSPADEGLRCLP